MTEMHILRRYVPVLTITFLAATTACSTPAHPASKPSQTGKPPARRSVTERAAHGRFTVLLGGKAVEAARSAGVSLRSLVADALDRINALLPGPKTTISVMYSTPRNLITQTGAYGLSDSRNRHITVYFGETRQANLHQALESLPRVFSHEVDHIVRASDGQGLGGPVVSSLLQDIVAEGISSVFDETAFPGPPNPWDRAISPSQECAAWKKAQPSLRMTGYSIYAMWFFGVNSGNGTSDMTQHVPFWTGFTIGYDIIKDYRRHHPRTSWTALTAASATAILAGSHYDPCQSGGR
jgi:uncharacterized protein YjaZ